MKAFQIFLLFVALLSLNNSCSILKTSGKTNDAADFSKYTTFKMVRFYNQEQLEQKGIYISEEDVKFIDQAIVQKAKETGLKWSEKNELLVMWTFGLDLKSSYSKATQAGAYGTGGIGMGSFYNYSYGAYGSPTYSSVSERETVKGKLSIALVDAKTKEMLWLGEGRKKMKKNIENRDPEVVKAAVERIMSTFPYPLEDK